MNIEITLPDSSKQPAEAGSRPIDIARAISPRLARIMLDDRAGHRHKPRFL